MVRLALRNPHVVIVMALAILIFGVTALDRIPTDLLPIFKTPAVQILTFYPGMPAEVVEKDITTRLERWTGQANGVARQESKSLIGVSIVKDFFRPDIDPNTAMSQVTSLAMSDLYYLPPGTIPPMVMPFDPTATIPLALITVSSPTFDETKLYDVAYFDLRNRLQGITGVIAPAVYGGKLRRILAYVDREKLQARGLSPMDVVKAIKSHNLMIPTGNAKFGALDYQINANSMVPEVDQINDFPIKIDGGAPIFVKDVAHTEDSYQIQTNVVRVNGRRQVYIPIYRQPGANTIQIVDGVKKAIGGILERLPKGIHLDVVMENISRHLGMGKSPLKAAMDGAGEVATPVLIITLTIVAVFFPVVFLSGIGKFLFTPLALSVTFALTASYILAMTLVPTCASRFLKVKTDRGSEGSAMEKSDEPSRQSTGHGFERWFDPVRERYGRFLQGALARKKGVLVAAKVKVAEEAVAISERLVRQTEVWVELGAGFKGDVLRARAQLAHNRLNLLRAKEELRVVSIRLATILRLDPQTQLRPTDAAITAIDLIPQGTPVDPLIQKALAQRPELQESRFQVNAFEQERKRAIWGPLIPGFHFGSPLGGFGPTPGNLSSSEDYSFFLGWRIGPGGLFDQGRKEAAEAQYKTSALQWIRIRETVVQEVMIAHTNLKTQVEQMALAHREVEEAQESLRLNQERQRMGVGLPLEVIQAEEALTRARIDLIDALSIYNKAQYRLFTAIGGEF